jgi:L-ascorbate metabolism protein UlaG (beta-lactamase superfamily)
LWRRPAGPAHDGNMATTGGAAAEAGLSPSALTVRLIAGATALIGIGGLRLLTDPTFDPPGDHPVGSRTLVKTQGPAVAADRCGPIDVALLFAGAALSPLLDGPLTRGSEQAAEAARILGARTVVPLHTEGWQHFTEGPATVAEAFARSGQQGQLLLLAPGEAAELA